MNPIQNSECTNKVFPLGNSFDSKENKIKNVVNSLLLIAIPLAFIIPGILGLKGRIHMLRGGAITLLALGSFVALGILAVFFETSCKRRSSYEII